MTCCHTEKLDRCGRQAQRADWNDRPTAAKASSASLRGRLVVSATRSLAIAEPPRLGARCSCRWRQRSRREMKAGVGAVPDLAVHGQNGLPVQPGEVGARAEAIIELLEDPVKWCRFGAAARPFAFEWYDCGVVGARIRASEIRPGFLRRSIWAQERPGIRRNFQFPAGQG
jgi:hypothetical protein